MEGFHKTTDHSVIVHHESECIECRTATTQETMFPSSEEAYECSSCGVVVAIEKGETVVRGDVSQRVIDEFSLREV